jgi:PhnB protein
MPNVKAVPDGHHTVSPYLVVDNAAAALEFYTRAFQARELFRMPGPDGRIMHAELQIGDSIVMLSDEAPEMGARSPKAYNGSPVNVFLYLPDVDATFARATGAGATAQMPPTNMFWGDRFAQVVDPFGHGWQLATHVEDVPPEEMAKRAAAAMG